MSTNELTYTQRRYKRNKFIFNIIKILITILYIWIQYGFFLMLNKTAFSLLGFFISSVIWYLLFRVIRSMELQNEKDIKKNDVTWGRGSEAEKKVGLSLQSLPSEYKIVEDFYTGKGNIDFIVIGPTGVLIIEVKANPGFISYKNRKITINNRVPEKDYMQQTIAERLWLTDILNERFAKDYPVIGLLEFPNGKIDKSTIKGPIGDNLWIGEGAFHSYIIKNSRSYLSPQEVSEIYSFLTSQRL